MDPFAHLASGALVGRAFRPDGPRWLPFALFGAAAGVSPDLDAPLALFGPEAWSRWHQLYTHSLVGVVWVPLLLSAYPFQFAPWRQRYAVALAGWLLHVILDVSARWPVPVLWPVSDQAWALYTLRSDFSWSVDMLFVVGLGLSLWDRAMPYARWTALGSFVAVGAWLALGLPT